MAIHIFSNNIGNPAHARHVEEIVKSVIGTREGEWSVHINEPANSADWSIMIAGPEQFRWFRRFSGIEEQDPDGKFIRHAVAEALPK